jgi:uncharacterized protein (TIGR04552 family)
LLYLTERLFPFTYVVPLESTNTIIPFRSDCEKHPHLRHLLEKVQEGFDDVLQSGDNAFTAPTYRVIHFVTDVPVRVPAHIMEMAPDGSDQLGPIVYMLCEFQLLDAESEALNESGDASHEAYKRRQKRAVVSRLRLSPKRAPLPDNLEAADATGEPHGEPDPGDANPTTEAEAPPPKH